jgi:hypothetical protein
MADIMRPPFAVPFFGLRFLGAFLGVPVIICRFCTYRHFLLVHRGMLNLSTNSPARVHPSELCGTSSIHTCHFRYAAGGKGQV